MIFKIVSTPFAKTEILPIRNGDATNIYGNFEEYELTEKGQYLISNFGNTDLIASILYKTATTYSAYTAPAIIDYNPNADTPAIIDEATYNLIDERLFEMGALTSFATKNQTNYNACASFFLPKETFRQFSLIDITNIDGTVKLVLNRLQGTAPKNFVK